jgi:hypothetical protein
MVGVTRAIFFNGLTFLKISIVKFIQPHIVSEVVSVGSPRVYPFPKSLNEPKIVHISKSISLIFFSILL